MAVRSKRTVKKEFTSKTGVILTDGYCRKCMKDKSPKDFYQATDNLLDSNGIFSICKECCFNLYDAFYLTERTFDRTILRMCRTLNIAYDNGVVDSVRTEITNAEKAGKKPKQPFSLYRSRVGSMLARGKAAESELEHDLSFHEPRNLQPSDETLSMMSHDDFWGENYTIDQVDFLEREYSSFKQNYSTDTHATVVLLKIACKKLLAIREEEDSGGRGVGTLEKQLMGLMKELAISPAHAKAASGGKMRDVFGLWIEEIERDTPAEWMENEAKDLHHDVDNVHHYYSNYIERPIRTFMTGNADYNIIDDDGNLTSGEV